MADYRTTRTYRELRESDSDDERYNNKSATATITRYKVKPRVDRYERTEKVVEMEDERRSRYSGHGDRSSNDFVEYDRRERVYVPERPRSAMGVDGDRTRTILYERDVDRREPDRDWDRRSRHDRHDDEVRFEKRVDERFDDAHGHEIERYRKETEYYREPEHPSSPVLVRQRAPDQKIIVQEAPQQIVIPRQEPGIIVLREREANREVARAPYDEEYYYRHERREVGPYKDSRQRQHHHRRRDEYYSDDDDYYYSRRTVRRERSEGSDHHKRHLAEGALAGAGITALLQSRPNEYGELPENRGKKVLAGAALGALGSEALKRAHTAYEENWGDGRESPDHHSRLKTGLGLAAVALAAAGAVKYHQASKAEKDEIRRGRSRTRGGHYSSGEDHSVSPSRSRSRRSSRKHSLSTFAKAALGTATTAGVIEHFRKRSKSKSRSKSRHGSGSRSKSKLRRGAELAGAAAAAGVAGKLWKDHRNKKKEREASASRGLSDDDHDYDGHDSPSRSRSRSRLN